MGDNSTQCDVGSFVGDKNDNFAGALRWMEYQKNHGTNISLKPHRWSERLTREKRDFVSLNVINGRLGVIWTKRGNGNMD